jgi:hypothetical protein
MRMRQTKERGDNVTDKKKSQELKVGDIRIDITGDTLEITDISGNDVALIWLTIAGSKITSSTPCRYPISLIIDRTRPITKLEKALK